jgi:hypothetical protein
VEFILSLILAEIANQLNGTALAAFGSEQTQQKLPRNNAPLADDDERNRQASLGYIGWRFIFGINAH